MVSFLVSEVALFGTLIVAYIFYLGRDVVRPDAGRGAVAALVLFTTACLLTSSATVHMADRALGRGNKVGFSYCGGWLPSRWAPFSWQGQPSNGTI